MRWFLYLAAFFWIGAGLYIVIAINSARRLSNRLISGMDGINRRLLGLSILIFGILFAASAWWSKHFWFIFILGLVAVIKGLVFLSGNQELFNRAMIFWRQRVNERSYRIWGLVIIILGLFVLFAV